MRILNGSEIQEIRKAHGSPPLVGEDNFMVFTSHSVPFHFLYPSDGKQILIVYWCEENEMVFVSHSVAFPATSDQRSGVAGDGT